MLSDMNFECITLMRACFQTIMTKVKAHNGPCLFSFIRIIISLSFLFTGAKRPNPVLHGGEEWVQGV